MSGRIMVRARWQFRFGWRRNQASSADVRRLVGRISAWRPRANDERDAVERARTGERARTARAIDLELQVACRMETASRRLLGDAARVLLDHHLYRRLGFVRLADYARERLGLSARTVQSAAWLAARLDVLPAVSTAFDRSEISWTQARAICAVASATDEAR